MLCFKEKAEEGEREYVCVTENERVKERTKKNRMKRKYEKKIKKNNKKKIINHLSFYCETSNDFNEEKN